mgnify:CR=1 FL=1
MNKITSLLSLIILIGCTATQSNIKTDSIETFNLSNYNEFNIKINNTNISAEVNPIVLERFKENLKCDLDELFTLCGIEPKDRVQNFNKIEEKFIARILEYDTITKNAINTKNLQQKKWNKEWYNLNNLWNGFFASGTTSFHARYKQNLEQIDKIAKALKYMFKNTIPKQINELNARITKKTFNIFL